MARRYKDLSRPDTQELKKELQTVNFQLKCAYERFDYICEPELIDACIYEIKSLKARYDYLLRCVKEQEGCSPSVVRAAGNVRGGSACLS